jgi:hypothetical protein
MADVRDLRIVIIGAGMALSHLLCPPLQAK